MGKGKKPKFVQERIARNGAAKAAAQRAWLAQKVYGRKDDPAPPEEPSQSVRAVPSAVESSRRRH